MGRATSSIAARSPSAVYEMAAHLLLAETPFSRNRNYEAFGDPRFKSAIALYRRLRALVSDLERARRDGTSLTVTPEPARVRLDFIGPRLRRTAWIERPAFDVLMMHPTAQRALSG
jgi:hypothetical protein